MRNMRCRRPGQVFRDRSRKLPDTRGSTMRVLVHGFVGVGAGIAKVCRDVDAARLRAGGFGGGEQPIDDACRHTVRRGRKKRRSRSSPKQRLDLVEAAEFELRIRAPQMRKRRRHGRPGLAVGQDGGNCEARMPGEQPQQLTGDVTGAAQHNGGAPLGHAPTTFASPTLLIPSLVMTKSPRSAGLLMALNASKFICSRMSSTPTILSVAGPVTALGSMPKRSRSSFTPPHAATGSFADKTTAVSAALISASWRMDCTPYVPNNPSPNSNTITSGRPLAISVSMVRVRAGPHFSVVVTIPRSVKIMVRR